MITTPVSSNKFAGSSQTPNTTSFSNTPDKYSIWLFSSGIGLSILGYLNPLHSPIDHDFLVNAISFIIICLSLANVWLQKRSFAMKHYSLSIYTWISLATLLALQPLLHTIRYPDALMFPIAGLIVVTLISLMASNLLTTLQAKRQFINQISIYLYLTLILSFVVQVMQAMNYNISLAGWPVTRLTTIPDRLDGNFGQANHTAYAYIFGICCVIYHLHTLKKRSYQAILVMLLSIFAIGIALTKSRAVLLMFGAVLVVYFFAQKGELKKQISWCVGILAVFVVSYLVGGAIMSAIAPDKVDLTGGMGRIVSSGMDSQRMALTRKAIMIFQDSPLTGIGWQNFTVGAIPHVDEMTYVTFSDHSHMVFTQIASELGIIGLLCLVPLLYVFVRSIHNRHSPESAMALAFVVATSIYACFEYPLWYFRFLAVFGLFVAMIEQKEGKLSSPNTKLNKFFGLLSVGLAMISSYYIYQFWTHKYLFWYTHPSITVDKEGNKQLIKGQSVFGFLNYSDMDLATIVEVSPESLPQKLALFDRVIVEESSVYNLVSYGQLLSFNGEYTKALNMFKTACRLNETKQNCDEIGKALKESSQQYPQNFQVNYQAYQAWLKTRNLR